jgi:indolepyruvate ferredoxin oxidoreductase alpha subunit
MPCLQPAPNKIYTVNNLWGKEILLGDEAIALGAIHAGISGAYAYPGTPSTEILEYVEKVADKYNVHAIWSANEKVAYEEALGMSSVGKRAIVSMKHVGLNVAADPFVNSAITGAEGGMVVIVADDPGMHSSQNEQDSRYYADFALIPCFEPSNQQEAYDMTREALDYSEKIKTPVMMRITTRLAHSRADVQTVEQRKQNELKPDVDWHQWTLLPSNARKNYVELIEKHKQMLRDAEISKNNILNDIEGDRAYIVAGIAYNYFREAIGDQDVPYLKITQYPIPEELIHKLVQGRSEVVVIEDGYPLIESKLRGILGTGDLKVKGKLSGDLPRTGELTPDIVTGMISGLKTKNKPVEGLPGRPPQLCKGCAHADIYEVLNETMAHFPNGIVYSDIGCYTLGALPPYNAISSCVDMGASISMANGASHAGLHPAVAVIGDSTFGHSGMTSLLDAVYQDSPITVIVADNATTGMTGGQMSMTCGDSLLNILEGLGVNKDHFHVLEAHKSAKETNYEIFMKELAHDGLSVIVAARECIQAARRRKKAEKK